MIRAGSSLAGRAGRDQDTEFLDHQVTREAAGVLDQQRPHALAFDPVQQRREPRPDLDRIGAGHSGIVELGDHLDRRFISPFGPAAVVMIDCDLGSGTTAALHWLEDGLLQPGSVVLLDDWHAAGGQREAFEAWLAGSRWRGRPFADWPKHGVGWQLDRPQAPCPAAG